MEEKVLYQVRDEGDLRKYYTTIPNIIDDMDLSVYAYRLYGHLKRVAGDGGKCWQSTETLAKACGMGWATVSRAKTELVGKELIIIEQVKNPQGGKDFHNITITDVWENNTIKYAPSTQEVATSHQEIATSHQEIKNNPIKNNMEEEGENAGAIFRAYESEIGSITPMISEELQELEKEHPTEWIIAAMRVASINGKRSLGYFKAILKRWKVDGYGTELKAQKRANGKDPLAGIREFLEEIGDGKPN